MQRRFKSHDVTNIASPTYSSDRRARTQGGLRALGGTPLHAHQILVPRGQTPAKEANILVFSELKVLPEVIIVKHSSFQLYMRFVGRQAEPARRNQFEQNVALHTGVHPINNHGRKGLEEQGPGLQEGVSPC